MCLLRVVLICVISTYRFCSRFHGAICMPELIDIKRGAAVFATPSLTPILNRHYLTFM